jgi:hypothetical protein
VSTSGIWDPLLALVTWTEGKGTARPARGQGRLAVGREFGVQASPAHDGLSTLRRAACDTRGAPSRSPLSLQLSARVKEWRARRLIAPPRFHMLRYHLLAAHAKARPEVVAGPVCLPVEPTQIPLSLDGDATDLEAIGKAGAERGVDGPGADAGRRKLLESKDCAVGAALALALVFGRVASAGPRAMMRPMSDHHGQEVFACIEALDDGKRVARAADPALLSDDHGSIDAANLHSGTSGVFFRRAFKSHGIAWAALVAHGHVPTQAELAEVMPGWASFSYSEQAAWQLWEEIAAVVSTTVLMRSETDIENVARRVLAREAQLHRVDDASAAKVLGRCLGLADVGQARAKWLLWVAGVGPQVLRPT